MKDTILFLCTGNYYRSRFAEILFNERAREADLPWMACSRGLHVKFPSTNVGPISPNALAGLEARGVGPGPLAFPETVTDRDLAEAEIIVALKEAEHRPMLHALHPRWSDGVVYWNVDDVPPSKSYDPLQVIEDEIDRLVPLLHRQHALGS